MTDRIVSYRLTKKVVETKPKTSWHSIYLSCFVIGFASLNMTIYALSTWSYLEFIRPGSKNLTWLGWGIGSTSLGSVLADPLLGWWQEKRNSRGPLICGFIVTCIGNMLYALFPVFPNSFDLYVMIVSKVCLGFASSAIGILRTFVTMSSLEEDRLECTALLSIGLTVGLSLGPVVQMVFSFALGDRRVFVGPLDLNQFSVPALVMAMVSVFLVIMIFLFFKENLAGLIEKADHKDCTPIPPFDRVAMTVLFIIWCLMMTAASSEYSISGALTKAMYRWEGNEYIEKHGFIQMAQCLLSAIAAVILMKTRVRKLDHRIQLIFSLGLLILASISLYPWPFFSDTDQVTIDRFEHMGNITIPDDQDLHNCQINPDICVKKKVPLPLYIISLALFYGPAASIGLSVTNTLASLVVGPRQQGLIQGWMTAAGSLASFIWPVVSPYLFDWNGMIAITTINGAFYLFGVLLIIIFRRRLIPLRV